jgi:hypothetical protein
VFKLGGVNGMYEKGKKRIETFRGKDGIVKKEWEIKSASFVVRV